MPSKTKRLLAALTAAASLAVAAPATAAETAAVGPCGVKPLFGVTEWYQEVLVTGHSAPAGAIDVELTCGVVRYGQTVARVTDPLPGPVAALAEWVSVHAGPVSSCYELYVTYIDHTTYADTCP